MTFISHIQNIHNETPLRATKKTILKWWLMKLSIQGGNKYRVTLFY